MNKLIAVLAAAALFVTTAAPPVLAGYGARHHGGSHGGHDYGGSYYKQRPYYGYGYGRGYGQGHGYRYRSRGRHHGYYSFHGHGDAAVVLGVIAGAVVLGGLLSRPYYPPAPAVAAAPAPLGNCVQTTGTGTWYGRPARFGGTMCYDQAGRAYVIRGSERFLHYLP